MRANIAAMVVNPADLERPQAEQPSDATRREAVDLTIDGGASIWGEQWPIPDTVPQFPPYEK